MDREELASIVTREVMKRMKRLDEGAVKVSSDREVLVLLNYADRRLGDLLDMTRRLVGTRDRVTLAVSDEVSSYAKSVGLDLEGCSSSVVPEGEMYRVLHNMAIFTTVLIPIPKASFLQRLLELDDSDRFVDLAYQGMLAGAQVVLLTDAILPSKERERAVPLALQNRIRNLLARVRNMNVAVTDMAHLGGVLGGGQVAYKKRLITEKDIIALARGTRELRAEPGCIITPSARDRARELGIRIIQK